MCLNVETVTGRSVITDDYSVINDYSELCC